jgi:hypothetical protein
MSDAAPLDALLDDVLSGWSVEEPPEDFAARVAAHDEDQPMQMPTPTPTPSDRTRPWLLPALMALAAATLVWLWQRPDPPMSSPAATPMPVSEKPPIEAEAEEDGADSAPRPVDLAQLEADWALLSRDIESANQLFPFADVEQDLDFAEFERLYAPGGEADQFGRKLVPLLETGEYRRLAPEMVDTLTHIDRLQALLYPVDGPMSLEFDVMLATGAGSTHVTLEVDGSAVRYRNGPRTWERLSFGPPTKDSKASLVNHGLTTQMEIDASGPWAFFRLLRLAEDTGPTGDFAGPFRFELVETDLGPVVVSLDGEPRDEKGTELRRLLTRPIPVQPQLFKTLD